MYGRLTGWTAAVGALALAGCGVGLNGAAVPDRPAFSPSLSAHVSKNCSSRPPKGRTPYSFNPTLSNPLTLGTRASASLEMVAEDNGGLIQGPLSAPFTLTLNDPGGHVRMSCEVVWDTRHVPAISSDGYGDSFSIRVAYGSAVSKRSFTTTLPKDTSLSTHSWQVVPASLRFGSDGNLWGALSFSTLRIEVARMTTDGRTTIFTDSNKDVGPTIEQTTLGADGNMWIPYVANEGGGACGMDRLTPSGAFTEMPFYGTDANDEVSGLVVGKHRDFILGVELYTGKSGFLSFDVKGRLKHLATYFGAAPKNLVWGPDGNVWFDYTDAHDFQRVRIGKLTPDGKITTYAMRGTPHSGEGPFSFVLGPDGKFWAPFPYGGHALLKFDTSGKVVSVSPLKFDAFWSDGATSPAIVDYAVDPKGNIYAADQRGDGSEYGAGGLIRFTPDGAMSEYPMYTTGGQSPTSVVRDGRTGKLYLGSTYFVQNSVDEGSIVAVDPSYW